MKFIAAFLAVVYFVSFSNAALMDQAQAKQMATELLTACKSQEGASDSDLQAMLDLKFPGTDGAKCMLACVHETVGILKDGNFLKDKFMAFAGKMSENDPECMKMAGEVADKCGTITGTRCEQATAFSKCLHDEAKARNFELPEVL